MAWKGSGGKGGGPSPGVPWINPGYNYVFVQAGPNAVTNGARLLAAYATAAALTPGGNALSQTNRTVVMLMPGGYDLGNTGLVLNTSYVDIVGWQDNRSDTVITSAVSTITYNNSIVSELKNLSVRSTWAGVLNGDANDLAPLVFERDSGINAINCSFASESGAGYPSMRTDTDLLSGSFTDCTTGEQGFGVRCLINIVAKNCTAAIGTIDEEDVVFIGEMPLRVVRKGSDWYLVIK